MNKAAFKKEVILECHKIIPLVGLTFPGTKLVEVKTCKVPTS